MFMAIVDKRTPTSIYRKRNSLFNNLQHFCQNQRMPKNIGFKCPKTITINFLDVPITSPFV